MKLNLSPFRRLEIAITLRGLLSLGICFLRWFWNGHPVRDIVGEVLLLADVSRASVRPPRCDLAADLIVRVVGIATNKHWHMGLRQLFCDRNPAIPCHGSPPHRLRCSADRCSLRD